MLKLPVQQFGELPKVENHKIIRNRPGIGEGNSTAYWDLRLDQLDKRSYIRLGNLWSRRGLLVEQDK